MSSLKTRLETPFHWVKSLLFDPRYFWTLATLVLVGDALLTQLIIRYVSYTEIDWETYMIQTELYSKGERNYANISGPTGPLVYPAGHVYIHQLLYHITNAGKNVALAQQIYAALYVASQFMTCAIYRRAGNLPNWILLALPLSKRLHSIYVLRLFNDCWSIIPMQVAILAYQRGMDDLAILFFSAALSVKMSILLYLPGVLVIVFKRKGFGTTIRHLITIVASQVLIARQFLDENSRSYLQGSFDLGRVFLYKWTVNWRFVDEKTFLSHEWAIALLLAHVTTLGLFGWFRWCRGPDSVFSLLGRGLLRPNEPAGLIPADSNYVTVVLFTSNLIGITFARSLHYQFYCWYAQQVPFLAWKTRYPIFIQIFLMIAIEYAWNVFPSTSFSSVVLFVSNCCLLVGIWGSEAESKAVITSKR